MKKRLLAGLMACALVLSLLPTAAFAADGDVSYQYCDNTGQSWQTGTKSSGEYTAVTAEDTAWNAEAGGWYVASGTVTIGQRVTVTGDVHLILEDGCALTINGGIGVNEGNSITIYAQSEGDSMGELTAQNPGNGYAGIGGYRGNSGTITINGGTVTANGGSYGAGIGGGLGGAGGTITINGGKITATNTNGTGIGGGYNGAGGTITINGGTIVASGAGINDQQRGGAGIGGGFKSAGGTITINGGNIRATGLSGAGIGGGYQGEGGTITITGGTICAEGGDGGGAGIGGGSNKEGGTTTITGGNITAISKIGAGIGGGFQSAGGTIAITGGSITATTRNGAGIGGGGNGGGAGTFSTMDTEGNPGNAFIILTNCDISDKTYQSNGSGVIFVGNNGKVYGNPTLTTDAAIPENKTLVIEEGHTLTIGEGVTLSVDGTLKTAGNSCVAIQGGGTVEIGSSPTITITPPAGGGNIDVDTDDSVLVPGGFTIQIGNGPEITVGDKGGTVSSGDGGITVPDGGTVQIGNNPATTITVPEGGGTIRPKLGGSVDVPGGSTVQTGDNGPEITVGDQGGTVGGDGGITVPDGGTVQIGNPATTITPPNGGEVKPKEDGTIEVPGGTTVKPGDGGPEITVGPGNGGTVGGNGGVTVEGSGKVTVKGNPDDTTITLPSGGGTVKPKPDGSIPLPGGSTVETENGDPVSIPDGGGVFNPDTGEIELNTHIVTINGGTGGGSYAAGDTVIITATVPSGQRFMGWTVNAGSVTLADASSATTTFTMPAQAVTVTANFENAPAPTFLVTVNGGTGGGSYTAGDTITITAIVPTGQRFTGWTVNAGGVTLANASSATTTFTMPAGNVTVTANFQTNTTGGSSGSGGGGSYTPPKKNEPQTGSSGGWNDIQKELENTKPGDDVNVTMNGATEVPKRVLDSIAGKDIDVNFDMGGGVVWTVNGQDIPAGIGSLNLGIKTGSSSIPVNVVNAISGEKSTMQFTLAHSGPFGTVLSLSLDLGMANCGYWANLYWFDESIEELVFQHSFRIDDKGKASWPFDHASSYAVVIDEKNHDPAWENPFTDVSEGDWYYEAVRFVHERGLMNGYSDGRFGPNDPLSRAQLAQILFNKEGRPGVNYLLTFSDVAGEAWYTEAIRWATSQGIVGGYGNGMFGPNDPITREQLAVMLWRYVGSPAATNKELHFNDTDEISGFALEAMRWAVENGVLNGYGDGRLGPKGQATRAQVAQMLKNFIEKQEEENT